MNKNKFVKSILVSSVALSATFAQSALASPIVVPDAPQIAAKGYVLMDYHSGKVLAEKEMNTKLSPASLTKMMTSYVIGQELARGNISEDDDVTISKNAWAKNFPDSSKMFIEVGTTVKVRDLNRGIIVQSGNDACVAMAEHIAGSEDAFVDLMNAWANTLGMTNSHFANVHGLDNAELYSTPYDMALLGKALIRDVPNEYRVYSEKKFTYNGITQYNRNGLLWDKSMNVDGIKTGHTSNAGYSLVSSATEGQMRLVAVVMGTKDANARKSESKKLLSYGFRFFETVAPHKAGETFVEEKVWMGNKDTVALGLDQDTYVTLPRGEAKNLKASFVLEKELEAPINKGDVVGKLYYQIDGEDIAEYPLMALETVEQGSLFSRMWDYIVLLFKSFF
ncbi:MULTISPECIES: serine hydrolase [Vibrio]|jgi:D-alanyl-D-alanine carboxypeptidase (penicillin-binding protein 5/6)|uniref:serine-type D-Ala-D-Ala carboxypeptidase n=4 Tax=Vibrio harveyi group TaxID=717610 RepID=A0A0H0YJZ9_VIBAL|nr:MULTISPECIES: serine hydrolase [Vibrio]EEZ84186.1 D-alanyl-D-alanine carboxypeptidase [Vibrio alginolyticus 40B]MDG2788355.1 serine hydrolase [Vibrio parahaemolyticus]MDW1811568.1 serine hydrolase [Vibrio sp. Vb2362]MDW1971687.1 serine hydrolase [Vibrio sp. 945]MDW2295415.1 serine hydrolase [Vibrio sp. 1404]NAW92541.1 D-alanyl-D-alanine carboxypeptidase [Vibrio sp. V42_P2S4T144]QCO85242.1 D-alanyl-D-alanine carboxypeptidase [Vibrio neocaledonicus]QIR87810.1 D-alanyl-D-alanine carboxypept